MEPVFGNVATFPTLLCLSKSNPKAKTGSPLSSKGQRQHNIIFVKLTETETAQIWLELLDLRNFWCWTGTLDLLAPTTGGVISALAPRNLATNASIEGAILHVALSPSSTREFISTFS